MLWDLCEGAVRRGRELAPPLAPVSSGTCFVCLEEHTAERPLARGGCACRGEAGLAHLECFVALATTRCGMCTREYGGLVRIEIAYAVAKRDADWTALDRLLNALAHDDALIPILDIVLGDLTGRDRLVARTHLASCYAATGRSSEALEMRRANLREAENMVPRDEVFVVGMRLTLGKMLVDMGKLLEGRDLLRGSLEQVASFPDKFVLAECVIQVARATVLLDDEHPMAVADAVMSLEAVMQFCLREVGPLNAMTHYAASHYKEARDAWHLRISQFTADELTKLPPTRVRQMAPGVKRVLNVDDNTGIAAWDDLRHGGILGS